MLIEILHLLKFKKASFFFTVNEEINVELLSQLIAKAYIPNAKMHIAGEYFTTPGTCKLCKIFEFR